jgi:hypothetical protein
MGAGRGVGGKPGIFSPSRFLEKIKSEKKKENIPNTDIKNKNYFKNDSSILNTRGDQQKCS